MKIAFVEYDGNLRITSTHLKSNQHIITDAPTDNNGKGQAFSPTDLLCTSLASCAMTVMAIHAKKQKMPFEKATAIVSKTMGVSPRKIIKVKVEMTIEGEEWPPEFKNETVKIGLNCPVALTLDPNLDQEITIRFVKVEHLLSRPSV